MKIKINKNDRDFVFEAIERLEGKPVQIEFEDMDIDTKLFLMLYTLNKNYKNVSLKLSGDLEKAVVNDLKEYPIDFKDYFQELFAGEHAATIHELSTERYEKEIGLEEDGLGEDELENGIDYTSFEYLNIEQEVIQNLMKTHKVDNEDFLNFDFLEFFTQKKQPQKKHKAPKF